ncbi:hypothetical protein MNBD_GAMMA25-1637 [hydrothermal vent metagenome]|uniref:FimV N-terminal domain-containing protein n=1 Tax=hydrothermal vent metagenome TaxID=652676 RepID=A0A3B1BIB9_9ZZZZ
MLRTLPRFLTACILIVMPIVASALGFGNIKLNSALNEPLDAEIGLLSATVDEVSGLTVKMASREAFLRAGVDRPTFLSSFNIEIKSRTDDSFYIHMTSHQPVREPFLNFLLELNWYNGRILREYTVLLDPPGRIIKQPAVIATPEVTEPAQIVRDPEPELVVEPEVTSEAAPEIESAPIPFPVPAPITIEAETDAVAEPEPMPVEEEVVAPMAVVEEEVMPESAEPLVEPETIQAETEILPEPELVTEENLLLEPMAVVDDSTAFSDDTELFPRIPLTEYQEGRVAQAVEPEPGMLAQGELDYGITRKGDNLWTVAKKLQAGDESVSIYQIMMALLKNNPDAFSEGNINRLKIGHVLRIEDPALLEAMSEDEARLAYSLQTEEWESYRKEMATAATADEPQPIIAGDLEAPADIDTAEASGELTVAAPGGEELTAGEGLTDTALNGEVATLKEELRQLRSDAEAMGGTDAGLNHQIKELETELADMQRAISIQDTELAAVQQMAGKANEADALEDASREEMPVAEELVVAEVEATEAESVAPVIEEELVVEETLPEQSEPVTEEPAMTEEPVQQPAPVVAPIPVPAAEPEAGFMVKVSAVFAGIAATLSGMMGSMAGDSLLLFVGLPILLVLIILMVIVMRRRKQAQDGFQESILTGEPAAAPADQTEAREEESSFLSDFAVSGAGAIQAEDSEVDPLTEADVFMAYGRYEAAEERLAEALENDPSRKELKLKLLELYSATKNQASFESTAEDFYASLGESANTDSMWEKVLAMGIALAPNNPLFTGDVVAPATTGEPLVEDPGVNLSDSQVMDIGLETGVFQAEDLEPEKEETSELDFNLDLGDELEPEVAEANRETAESDLAIDEQAATENSGIDFNLDLDSGSSDAESSEQPTAEMEMPNEDTGLDFNLDVDDSPATGTADVEALDLELDSGDETATDLSVDDATALNETQDAVDDLEFSLNLDDGSSDTVEVDGGEETDQTMVINLDDADIAVGENDDTAIDLNLDDSSVVDSAVGDTNDETMAIDLGDSLDFDAMDGEDTAADLTLDVEEASDAADLDLAAGGDEVGTKLDLARAYIDMGDPEGARSILDEVLDEGDDNQKQEAQQLIQQIA